jgi:murein DD-endopeptidase MepM/ murein hydrolase activator NlpD
MFSPNPVIKSCLLAAVLVCTLVAAPMTARASGEAAALERTRQELASIRKQLSAAQGQEAKIAAQVKALDAQVSSLNRQIRTGEHDISQLESDIRTTEQKIAGLQQRYGSAHQATNERARRIYKQGPASSLSNLLSARSVTEFIRLTVWWGIAAQIDGKTMIDSVRLRGDLADRRGELMRLKGDVNAQKSWLEQRRQLVSAAFADRAQALSSVQAQIRQDLAHIKDLERESQQLTAVIRSALSHGAASARGFIWPLRGQLTSCFCYRWGSFHPGIDIDGNTGDPIVAAKAGNVAGVACGTGYGICSIIDHGDGLATLYAHMSRKAVGGGQVSQGQVIGYVGCTGYCTGSHLHFEVRVNGEPRNPMNYLP